MSFPCTKCGCCCKRVGKVVLSLITAGITKDHPLYFPYLWSAQGACEKLIDNQCGVYDHRPLICNIDKLTEYFSLPPESRYQINIDACNRMMDDDNIDPALRISPILPNK